MYGLPQSQWNPTGSGIWSTKCLGLASTYFWPAFVEPLLVSKESTKIIQDWVVFVNSWFNIDVSSYWTWKHHPILESEKITLVSEGENPWLLSNISGLHGRSPADLGRGRGTSAPCHVCLQFGESPDLVCWSLVKQGINCLTCVWQCVYVNVSNPK